MSMKPIFRKIEYAICLALICLFAACSSASKEQRAKSLPKSIGQPSEVLLVLDQEVMASELKDTLRTILECDVPGLNQSESFFRVSRVPASIYKGEMLKMHSKLLIRIEKNLQETELKVAHDVDAKPQVQVLLASPSVVSLKDFLAQDADKVRQLLLDHQLGMQQAFLKRHHSKAVRKDLKAMGFDGLLPEEITFTKKGENFLWGSSRTNEKQLNFVFYRYDSDGSELSMPDARGGYGDLHRLCEIRDSVMQLNIPGSQPDQWMETVWEQGEPMVQLSQRLREGKRVAELRGLWQMRHGAMGGPFVSYLWYDENARQVVVLEGFVYSPSTEKRDLVRRLEAGMRTVK